MAIIKLLFNFRCTVIDLLTNQGRKIQTIMANVQELMTEIGIIKTNVTTIQAGIDSVETTVSNIDTDVKGLIKKIEDGTFGLDEALTELKGLSVQTGTAATEIAALSAAAGAIDESVAGE